MTKRDDTAAIAHDWWVRVYYEDTDCGGVVYHTAYLRFMERARTEWLRSLGLEQHELAGDWDRLFVVRGLSMNYRTPAQLDDALCIDSRIHAQGRTRLMFEQVARRIRDDTVCCDGRVEVVCVRASDGRPCGFPEYLRAELADVG